MRKLLFLLPLLMSCTTQDKYQQFGDVNISQTERGVVITSKNSILFDTEKYEVMGNSAVNFLDEVARIIKTKTKNSVLVEGHTDNIGGDLYNKTLSEKRAQAVVSELIKRGVDQTRIKSEGFGFNKPMADNSTEEGRANNRRTEIIILGENKESLGETGFFTSLKSFFSGNVEGKQENTLSPKPSSPVSNVTNQSVNKTKNANTSNRNEAPVKTDKAKKKNSSVDF